MNSSNARFGNGTKVLPLGTSPAPQFVKMSGWSHWALGPVDGEKVQLPWPLDGGAVSVLAISTQFGRPSLSTSFSSSEILPLLSRSIAPAPSPNVLGPLEYWLPSL